MKLTYTPRFFQPEKATQWYKPDLAAAMREGIEFGLKLGLKSAEQLIEAGSAHLLALTDLQNDFRDKGRLPVKGADEVILRVCYRLINGVIEDHFVGIIFSLDGHPFYHRSFDYVWIDKVGNVLDLSQHGGAAILTLESRKKCLFKVQAFNAFGPYTVGYYKDRFEPEDSVAYWDYLQKTNQGPIWVFVPHCILGTDGADLHPLLAETIAFACGMRGIQPTIIQKGHLYDTDWFGPLEPCRPNVRRPWSGFNKEVIEEMAVFRTVELAGIAEDFCQYSMEDQTMKGMKRTDHHKLRFLSDCTAPIVPGTKKVADLYARALESGVKFIQHDTPFER